MSSPMMNRTFGLPLVAMTTPLVMRSEERLGTRANARQARGSGAHILIRGCSTAVLDFGPMRRTLRAVPAIGRSGSLVQLHASGDARILRIPTARPRGVPMNRAVPWLVVVSLLSA